MLRTRRRTPSTRRPRLEGLEDRRLLTVFTVTNGLDSGTGSLRAAIVAANDEAAHPGLDTIRFAPGVSTVKLTSGELDVTSDLSILGTASKVKITRAGNAPAFRLFDLSEADVTMEDLTITGGQSEQGGAIMVDGGSLTLNRVLVKDNQAVALSPGGWGEGGGVYATGGVIFTAVGSTFRDNVAQGARGADGGHGRNNGAGGAAYGGAILADDASLSLVSCVFDENEAIGGRGGDGGAGVGTSSTPAYNDYGGNAGGGGVYLRQGSLTISRSSFTDNAALGGAGGNAAVSGGYSSSGRGGLVEGGAVGAPRSFSFWGDYSPVVVTDSSFEGNVARGGAAGLGGTVGSAAGAAILAVGPLTVEWSSFDGNTSEGSDITGGVVAGYGQLGSEDDPFAASTTINNSTFTDNRSTGFTVSGGVVYSAGLDVSGSTFTGNRATAISGGQNGPHVGGGVILSFDFTIDSSVFTSNQATAAAAINGAAGSPGRHGGEIWGGVVSNFGIFSAFSKIYDQTNTFNIIDSNFDGNQAIAGDGGRGGEGADGGDGGSVRGGVVYVPGWLTIIDSRFSNTLAVAGDGGRAGSLGQGGGGGNVHGGVVAVWNDFEASLWGFSPVTIIGSTFSATSARGGDGGDGRSGGAGGSVEGGAIDLYNEDFFGPSQTTATITDSRIINTLARGGAGGDGAAQSGGVGGDALGGGLFVNAGSTVALVGSKINGNIVQGGLGGRRNSGAVALSGRGIGGGVYLSASGSTRSGTKIQSNFASTSNDEVYGSFN